MRSSFHRKDFAVIDLTEPATKMERFSVCVCFAVPFAFWKRVPPLAGYTVENDPTNSLSLSLS